MNYCFVTESFVQTTGYMQLKNVPITNTAIEFKWLVYSENNKEANQLFSETKLERLSQLKELRKSGAYIGKSGFYLYRVTNLNPLSSTRN